MATLTYQPPDPTRSILGPDGRPWHADSPEGLKVPQVWTMSSLVNQYSKTYSWMWDEAYRQSQQTALAMRRDAFLMGLLNERMMPTEQMRWHIEPENKKDAKQVDECAFLEKVIRRTPYFLRYKHSCLQALWYGRAGAQQALKWDNVDGETAVIVSNHLPVNGDKIQMDWDGTPKIRVYAAAQSAFQLAGGNVQYADVGPLLKLDVPFWRDRFCVHKHEVVDADYNDNDAAGQVGGIGIRHYLYWLNWLRLEVQSWLMDFMERTGLGLTIYTYEQGNPQAEAAARLAAQQDGRNTVIVYPVAPGGIQVGAGVQRIETQSSGAEVIFKMIQTFFDDKIERFVIGQTLSSKTEGSGLGGTGVAKMHGNTKFQIIKNDCENLGDTLTEQLVVPLQRLNPKTKNSPWHYRFVFAVDEYDPEAKLKSAQIAYSMGTSFDEDEIRQVTGFSAPNEDSQVLKQADPMEMLEAEAALKPKPNGALSKNGHANGSANGNGKKTASQHSRNRIAEHYQRSLIEVPDIRQHDHYSCGAAAAMCVGRYFGVGPDSIDGWKKSLGTDVEDSTRPYAIEAYLKQLGLAVEARSNLSLMDLKSYCERGWPVITPVQDYGPEVPKKAKFPYGHYLTVIGVSMGYVFCQDSSADNVLAGEDSDAAPGRVMIREDDFVNLWHDRDAAGNQYECYGIAVGPMVDRYERNRLSLEFYEDLNKAKGGFFRKTLSTIKAGEKRLEKAMKGFFQSSWKKIKRAVDFAIGSTQIKTPGKPIGPQPIPTPTIPATEEDVKAIIETVQDALDKEELKAAAKPELERLHTEGCLLELDDNVKTRIGAYSGREVWSEPFASLKKKIPQELQTASAEFLDSTFRQPWWDNLPGEVGRDMADTLIKGVKEGEDINRLVARLQNAYADLSANRARLIARTESTGALNAGLQAARLAQMRKGLVVGKRWEDMDNGDVRPDHHHKLIGAVGVEEDFIVGGEACQYPGDNRLSAKQRCNCRCMARSIPAKSEDYQRELFPEFYTEKGRWVTIHGAHVLIKDGKIAKGPDHLVGKTLDEAHSEHAPKQNPGGKTGHPHIDAATAKQGTAAEKVRAVYDVSKAYADMQTADKIADAQKLGEEHMRKALDGHSEAEIKEALAGLGIRGFKGGKEAAIKAILARHADRIGSNLKMNDIDVMGTGTRLDAEKRIKEAGYV